MEMQTPPHTFARPHLDAQGSRRGKIGFEYCLPSWTIHARHHLGALDNRHTGLLQTHTFMELEMEHTHSSAHTHSWSGVAAKEDASLDM